MLGGRSDAGGSSIDMRGSPSGSEGGVPHMVRDPSDTRGNLAHTYGSLAHSHGNHSDASDGSCDIQGDLAITQGNLANSHP